MTAQALDVHRRTGGERSDIRHQPFDTGAVLACQHCRFAHPGKGHDLRLDFTQFDAEAADLYLQVLASEEFDGAVGQPAAEIAGAVHTSAVIAQEWIAEEALRTQVRTPQVTTRNHRPCQVQLADHAGRLRLCMRVEHVDACIGDRTTDGRQPRPLCRVVRQHQRGDDMGLGGAVVVVQLAACNPLEECRDLRLDAQLFACGDDGAQRTVDGRFRRQPSGMMFETFCQDLQREVRKEDTFDAPRGDELEQLVPAEPGVLVDQAQGAAVAQGAEHLLEGDIETECGEL